MMINNVRLSTYITKLYGSKKGSVASIETVINIYPAEIVLPEITDR